MSTATDDGYTPQERAKDKRLQKNYRWTLLRYRALERVQEGKCGICGREVKNAPMNVDHFHFKITTRRTALQRGWAAETIIDGKKFFASAKTKVEAMQRLKDIALPHSVRGLLCPGRYRGCNRLLGRIDDIEWLEKTLAYLRNPPARKLSNPL